MSSLLLANLSGILPDDQPVLPQPGPGAIVKIGIFGTPLESDFVDAIWPGGVQTTLIDREERKKFLKEFRSRSRFPLLVAKFRHFRMESGGRLLSLTCIRFLNRNCEADTRRGLISGPGNGRLELTEGKVTK